jgi:serine/threonine-protein kinase
MTNDPRLQRLLDQLLDSDATPEEVCAACPELLDTVRERWQQMRRARAELEAFFPSPTEPAAPHVAEEEALPQIPGYEVEVVLGRGGMGVVFKARHLTLDRVVALKMLLAGAYAAAEELARFRREAMAVAALRHPNIVAVHDAGEVDGRPYFTMEYVEGGTLAQSLDRKPQPARFAAELVAILATAVQFAHQSGFIHRDLKPANILLTPDGHPKITDFGLVRLTSGGPELTRTGCGVGTPAYMAPEQATGNNSVIGPGVDIYALGVILYQMLTGRPPFEGQSAAEILRKVSEEEVVPPSRVQTQVPRDLETICLKCLEKNPARRYASAQGLADDLHRFLDGKPILARPVGVLERVVKWGRRRPAVALLVGTLLVMLVAAAGIGIWLHQQEKERQAARSLREEQARDALRTALARADDLKGEERWQEGLDVLTTAASHLAEADSPQLQEQLHQARADFQFADRLEKVREGNPLLPSYQVDYPQREKEYRAAFEDAELRIEDAERAVEVIRASAIRDQLVAALEDRAFVAFMLKPKDMGLVEQLLTIAERADSGSAWRTRFRDPDVWWNRVQLQELAATAFTSTPPPSDHQLALLGLLLREVGAVGSCTDLLREACQRQPRNFWVHREMGFTLLREGRYLDSVTYCRAARTMRPGNADLHERLGRALFFAGRHEEAFVAYRRATELSDSIFFRTALTRELADCCYWKEAEAVCRATQGIDPDGLHPYNRLGLALGKQHRNEEAAVMFRRAIEKGVNAHAVYENLGRVLQQLGRHEEAITAFQKAVRLAPPMNLVSVQYLGQELAAAGRWEEAVAVLEAGARVAPSSAFFPQELSKILRAQGKPAAAARVLRAVPDRVAQLPFLREELADALLDQGRFAEARATVEKHLNNPLSDAHRRGGQRRLELCKAMLTIEGRVPAMLAGTEQPADAPTQRALAEWCLNHKRLPTTAAELYTLALTAQPSLADDLEAAHRFQAARAAALACCGKGADAEQLDEQRRSRLRQQALQWLTAEYDAWAEWHRTRKTADRSAAVTHVRFWQGHADLAGVRDKVALARLPAEERQAWQAFWDKVAELPERDPATQFALARDHVARSEWSLAANCYARGMELEPTDDGELWFEYAAVHLLTGDRAGYRKAYEHMLARCQPKGPIRRYLAARAGTLAPTWPDAPKRTLFDPGDGELNRGEVWALTERAALYCRGKEPREAVWNADHSLAVDGNTGRAVLNWLWLALAHREMGSPKEARRWLTKATDWLDQQGGQMPVDVLPLAFDRHNWLEAQVLRREAEALLR